MSLSVANREFYPILFERFPAAFTETLEQIKPLKIGIHEDLAATLPNLDPKIIPKLLHNYCGKSRYLVALAEGRPRIDLEGNVVGEVSEEIRKESSKELERRRGVAQLKEIRRVRAAEKQKREQAARQAREAAKTNQAKDVKKPLPLPDNPSGVKPSSSPPPPPPPLPQPKKPPAIIVKKKRTIAAP
ncbi:ProP effector [Gammaproteobacteria bacterium]